MKRFWMILLSFALTTMLFSANASALDLVAGVQLQGGAATDDDDDTKEEMGFGGGARVYALAKFMPEFAAGLNFDYRMYSHSIEDLDDASYSFSLPSAGLILRSEVQGMVAIDVVANYVFGTVTTDLGALGESDSDVSGFQFGLDALYRFQIAPYKTFVEVGPYFTYNLLTPEKPEGATEDPDSYGYLNYGLAVQGTFEFGL